MLKLSKRALSSSFSQNTRLLILSTGTTATPSNDHCRILYTTSDPLHTCPNLMLTLVQSATEWYVTSHMSKPNVTPNYGMGCFGTYFTHVQSSNVSRVQSATEWTASVHTLHMSKPNVTRVQSATEWDCLGTYFAHVLT